MDKETSNLLKRIKNGYESHKSALIFDIKKLLLTTFNLDYTYEVTVNFLKPVIIAQTLKVPGTLSMAYNIATSITVKYRYFDDEMDVDNMRPSDVDVIEESDAYVSGLSSVGLAGNISAWLDCLEIDNLYRISKALEELAKTCYNR